MRNLSLGKKLALAFATVTIIATILALLGYYGAKTNHDRLYKISEVNLPGVQNLMTIEAEATCIRGAMRALCVPGVLIKNRPDYYKQIEDSIAISDKAGAVYETLPKTEAEQKIWNEFQASWSDFKKVSAAYIELSKKFDKNEISDPKELGMKLEQFRKDHWILTNKILSMVFLNEPSFIGGDDYTACNAGKWLSEFKTDNSALANEILAIKDSHAKFHQTAGKIKKLIEA